MKYSHWPVFTNVKTNLRHVKFLTFRSFGNLLTSFCIGIAVSGLMLRLKAKEFSEDPEFKASTSAGTRNGSAAIPSAFAPKQHSLSVSQKIWSSLRGRHLKGKGKGVLCAGEMRGTTRVSLAPKTPFPFPFKRLPRRLDLEQQTVKFHQFVITSRQRHGYSLSRIFIFSVKTH